VLMYNVSTCIMMFPINLPFLLAQIREMTGVGVQRLDHIKAAFVEEMERCEDGNRLASPIQSAVGLCLCVYPIHNHYMMLFTCAAGYQICVAEWADQGKFGSQALLH